MTERIGPRRNRPGQQWRRAVSWPGLLCALLLALPGWLLPGTAAVLPWEAVQTPLPGAPPLGNEEATVATADKLRRVVHRPARQPASAARPRPGAIEPDRHLPRAPAVVETTLQARQLSELVPTGPPPR